MTLGCVGFGFGLRPGHSEHRQREGIGPTQYSASGRLENGVDCSACGPPRTAPCGGSFRVDMAACVHVPTLYIL